MQPAHPVPSSTSRATPHRVVVNDDDDDDADSDVTPTPPASSKTLTTKAAKPIERSRHGPKRRHALAETRQQAEVDNRRKRQTA